jgi:hypothetical protein
MMGLRRELLTLIPILNEIMRAGLGVPRVLYFVSLHDSQMLGSNSAMDSSGTDTVTMPTTR